MNKNELNKILKLVKTGKKVKFNELRSAASVVGIKTKAGVKADELVDALQGHISKVGIERGPGRPKADECPVVGYKVKVGLRYATEDGPMTTSMKKGKLFKTPEECQAAVDTLLANGTVRTWGPDKNVRAKFLPRYGKSE